MVVGARADARARRPRDRAPPRRRPAGGGARRPARARRAPRPPARRSGSAPRPRCWSSSSRMPTRGERGARARARRRRRRRAGRHQRRRRAAAALRGDRRPARGDPVGLARRAALGARRRHGQVRAAASRADRASASLRRAFHEARCALEATALADGDAPEVAIHQDLGAFTLLLSLQDDEALRLYSDGVLGRSSARRGRVRRRAAALARGVHRAQRPVGARGARALLPPPHAALPDPQDRGADRPRPVAGHATGSSSGWRCGRRELVAMRAAASRAGCRRNDRAGDRARPRRVGGGRRAAAARPRRGARRAGRRRPRRRRRRAPPQRRRPRAGSLRERSTDSTCSSTRPATGSTSTRCAPAWRRAATTSTSAASTG